MREVSIGELARAQAKRHPTENPGLLDEIDDLDDLPWGEKQRLLHENTLQGFPLVLFGIHQGSVGEGEGKVVPVASRRAIGELTLRPSLLRRERVDLGGVRGKLLLQDGDVVLSHFRPYRCAYVGSGVGAYVDGDLAVIRMDNETKSIIDPAYLAGWLSSDGMGATALLAKHSVWDSTKVWLREMHLLNTLMVLLPEMNVQHALGDLVRAKVNAEAARWAAFESEDRMLSAAYAKALRR